MQIIQAIKAVDYKNVLSRALWTFVQAFLAVFLFVSGSVIDLLFAGSWEALWGLLVSTAIGAVAAGLSALKTVVVEVVAQIKAKAE